MRQAHAAFHVESDVSPAIPADNEDYDGDGILNVDEAPGDTDGDCLDDLYDDDADNDDSADSVDPNPRDPNVPNPTTCGTEPVSIGCCEDLGDCDGTSSSSRSDEVRILEHTNERPSAPTAAQRKPRSGRQC